MNRGSLRLHADPRGQRRASMRPRFMNRGSRHPWGRCRCSTAGFNEAPIHESGKSGLSWQSSQYMLCFNEAPIHESGK